MKLFLLILAIIVGQLCWAEETTTSIPRAKNETGPGKYRSSNHGGRYHGGGYRKEGRGHKKNEYRAPVIDDYICDLEATILVVSSKHHVEDVPVPSGNPSGYGNSPSGYGNSPANYGNSPAGYGNSPQSSYGNSPQSSYGNSPQSSYGNSPQSSYGNSPAGYGSQPQQQYDQPAYGASNQAGAYGTPNQPAYGGQNYEQKTQRHEYSTPEALRLKCSHIAIYSEHDCQTCCKLSARRYHSVSKQDIFGFIVDTDQLKYDDDGYVRSKRSSNYNGGSSPAPSSNYKSGSAPSPGYNGGSAPSPDYSSSNSDASQSYGVPASSSLYEDAASPSDYSKGYSSGQSYGASSYGYNGVPKNARCVCCTPKRHGYGQKYGRNYDQDGSEEY